MMLENTWASTVMFTQTNEQKKTSGPNAQTSALNQNITAIAVGNGTAGRETEAFSERRQNFGFNIPVIMVNESGASVYSASEAAREEFPDLDADGEGSHFQLEDSRSPGRACED